MTVGLMVELMVQMSVGLTVELMAEMTVPPTVVVCTFPIHQRDQYCLRQCLKKQPTHGESTRTTRPRKGGRAATTPKRVLESLLAADNIF